VGVEFLGNWLVNHGESTEMSSTENFLCLNKMVCSHLSHFTSHEVISKLSQLSRHNV
jgi:hypothetical protein